MTNCSVLEKVNMTQRLLFAASIAFLSFTTLSAQDYGELDTYSATIAPEDMRSSSGTRLTTIGAVLQQDRVNFHRFGIRQKGDSGDSVFGDKAKRALIPQIYVVYDNWDARLEKMIRDETPFDIEVLICGSDGTPSVLGVVTEWVMDHSGCY